MQRDHWQPNGGIQTEEQLKKAFRHFLVDIRPHECRVLMKKYYNKETGMFDSKALSNDLFPKTRPSEIMDYTHPMGNPEHPFMDTVAPVAPPNPRVVPTQNVPNFATTQFSYPPRPGVHRPSMRGPSVYYMAQQQQQEQVAMVEQAMRASTAIPSTRTRRSLRSRQTRPASSTKKIRKPPTAYMTTPNFYDRRTRTTHVLPSVNTNTQSSDFFMRSKVSTLN
jgi:hypothetical protein